MEHPVVLEAWLQQRRKNFPSSGNVQLKKLREEAKVGIGIVARDKSYTLKGNQWIVKRHKPCIPEEKKPAPPEETTDNDPLSFILNSDSKKKPEAASSLLGMGAYDSSSESDSENNPPLDKNSSKTPQNPELAPDVKHVLNKFKKYAKWRGVEGNPQRKRQKWNGVMRSGRRRYQPTLLQRLLSRDVTRDHNKILQCIRYIVNNNFFDEPSSLTSETKEECENSNPATNHTEPSETTDKIDDSSCHPGNRPTHSEGSSSLTHEGNESVPQAIEGNKSIPQAIEGNESIPQTKEGKESIPQTNEEKESIPQT